MSLAGLLLGILRGRCCQVSTSRWGSYSMMHTIYQPVTWEHRQDASSVVYEVSEALAMSGWVVKLIGLRAFIVTELASSSRQTSLNENSEPDSTCISQARCSKLGAHHGWCAAKELLAVVHRGCQQGCRPGTEGEVPRRTSCLQFRGSWLPRGRSWLT